MLRWTTRSWHATQLLSTGDAKLNNEKGKTEEGNTNNVTKTTKKKKKEKEKKKKKKEEEKKEKNKNKKKKGN